MRSVVHVDKDRDGKVLEVFPHPVVTEGPTEQP